MKKYFDSIVVIDMETGRTLYRKRHPYNGPWALAKPKRSPLEGQATSLSSQDQAASTANENTAQGTLSQFEGPVQNSPYYKSLVSTGTDATSNAYQNAMANSRASANAAGFGYNQPIGQAASRETQNAEAGALAQVPTQAMNAAAPLSMQAAQDTAQLGETQGAQGLGYFSQAVPLEEQYQNMNNAFYNKLWNVGLGGVAGGTSGQAGDIFAGMAGA